MLLLIIIFNLITILTVHIRGKQILSNKKIVKTGDYKLVYDIEKNGYAKYISRVNDCEKEDNE